VLGGVADEELQRRPDSWQQLGAALLAFERPDYADAITGFVLDRIDPDRAPFGYTAIRSLYADGIAALVSRYYLVIDPTAACDFAEDVLAAAYCHWDHLGPLPFAGELVQRILGQLPARQPPTMPAELPPWLSDGSSVEERTFLRRSLVLERIARLVLFLTVYAGFTPWELAAAVPRPAPLGSPRGVEWVLRRAWSDLFVVL
jgi:hypothetical protein